MFQDTILHKMINLRFKNSNPFFSECTFYRLQHFISTYISWGFNIYHCVKSLRILSYFGPYFPAFILNTAKYSVSLLMRENTGTFYAMFHLTFGDKTKRVLFIHIWNRFLKAQTAE